VSFRQIFDIKEMKEKKKKKKETLVTTVAKPKKLNKKKLKKPCRLPSFLFLFVVLFWCFCVCVFFFMGQLKFPEIVCPSASTTVRSPTQTSDQYEATTE